MTFLQNVLCVFFHRGPEAAWASEREEPGERGNNGAGPGERWAGRGTKQGEAGWASAAGGTALSLASTGRMAS